MLTTVLETEKPSLKNNSAYHIDENDFFNKKNQLIKASKLSHFFHFKGLILNK